MRLRAYRWVWCLQFNVLFSTLTTLIVFLRYPSSASCVVTPTGYSDSVLFPHIFLGTCGTVTLGCAYLTSRDSLSVVILLLLSDPDEFGLSSLITTSSPMSSLLLARVTSCTGPVLTSLITLGCVPERILRRRLKGLVSSPALCPAQFSSWILGRVSFNCISQCAIDSFVSRSQQQDKSPPTCFAVSLLSSLSSSQVSVPRTPSLRPH